MERNKHSFHFSEVEGIVVKRFSVNFEIGHKLKLLLSLMDQWGDADRKELIKYIGITLRKKSKEADTFIDVVNENINNREVNYAEVNWLLDGIVRHLPDAAYWAMDSVPSFISKIKGAQRGLLEDITVKDNLMVMHFTCKVLSVGGSNPNGVITEMTQAANEIAKKLKELGE